MATYQPHSPGVVQTVFRSSRLAYEGYSQPGEETLGRVDTFLTCADWTKGLARIRCGDCGHSYFRPFSCKVFHLCPSCDQKRTILYAEYLAEELILDLPHRQYVFTIPKILRSYFRYDWKLFGEVSRLIHELLSGFFSIAAGEPLQCGVVVSYQTFGEFAHFHSHWHVLVLEGGFDKQNRFVSLPLGADRQLVKAWRESLLRLFQKKKLIDQNRADLIRGWNHFGFSVESETRLRTKADREALGQYIVRGPVSEQKLSYDKDTDTVTWTASPKGYYKGQKETFKGYEFMDRLVTHLPPRRMQLVRRYGIYAGKVRAQWPDRPELWSVAPQKWVESHAKVGERGDLEVAEAPDTWSRLRRKSWARLLKKIFEVDPFLCPKCGGTMAVVAVIEDESELETLIEWSKKEEARAPP